MDSLSWTDVPPRCLVLVPTGSYEQHGPHLPLHTDTAIATAVAQRVARELAGPVLVAAPFEYGASGEHQGFPGTMSIGTAALQGVLVELVRSVATWARRIVFVNGHGGNLAALRASVAVLRREGHDVGWVPCAVPAGDAHAGYVETSVMLCLAPDQVDLTRAVAGNREPLDDLMPALIAGGVGSVSANGILGDPRGASAGAGTRLLATMVHDASSRIRLWRPDSGGCLVPLDASVPA
jgi:mycofactocin system creatininase family protein